MALEDLALFRALPNSTVFYPSDAVSAERSVELAANLKGIIFIRTSRPANKVIYDSNEEFAFEKCKVLKKSDTDSLVIVTAGVILHETL